MLATGLISAALSAALAFVLVQMLIKPMSRLARRGGRVDHDSARKGYATYVPLGGGVTVVLATLLSSPFLDWSASLLGIMVGGAVALGVGLRHEKVRIRASMRLLGTIAAAVVAVLLSLGELQWPLKENHAAWLGWGTVVGSTAWMVLWTRIYRHVDRADGLLGLLALNALFWLTTAAVLRGLDEGNLDAALEQTAIAWPLAGALVAFLAFNARRPGRPRALVYMGAGGTMALGLCIGALGLKIGFASEGPMPLLMFAVWCSVVPLSDWGATVLRRRRHGDDPFGNDDRQLHGLMMAHGRTESTAVAWIGIAAFLLAGLGLLLWQLDVPVLWQAVGASVAFLAFTFHSIRFWQRRDEYVPEFRLRPLDDDGPSTMTPPAV